MIGNLFNVLTISSIFLVLMIESCPFPAGSISNSSSGGTFEVASGGTFEVAIDFVRVPAGSFQRDANAANMSQVSEFYISDAEITEKQFGDVMGLPSIYDSQPVVVTWYQAIAFCNTLSIKKGKNPYYSKNGETNPQLWGDFPAKRSDPAWDITIQPSDGYRLPTEAEWMWAAMGSAGSTLVDTTGYNKAFSGSDTTNLLDDYAWYTSNSNNSKKSVKNKQPNELKLYDMSGNVKEWCYDYWQDSFPHGKLIDYSGPSRGTERVYKGAGVLDSVSEIKINSRSKNLPFSSPLIGFRIVYRN